MTTCAAGCANGSDDGAIENASNDLVAGSCVQQLSCAPPALDFKTRPWRNFIKSTAITIEGPANHRGRDLLLGPNDPQNVIVQLAYGVTKTALNVDLVDEEVDIFVQRDCSKGWEKIGSSISTSSDTNHPPVEDVADHGGRVYFEIPADKRLGPGLHRIRVVVAGDGTATDLYLGIAGANAPLFVSDVDGTLTTSETVEFVKVLTDDVADVNAGAPEVLRGLASKGYLPVYLTARPEWLTKRTHEFLEARGLPPGILHTSLSATGAGFGASAAAFKKDELAKLKQRGFTPTWAFGNTSSDDEAYAQVVAARDHRVLFKLDGATGRRIDTYTSLVPEISQQPNACR